MSTESQRVDQAIDKLPEVDPQDVKKTIPGPARNLSHRFGLGGRSVSPKTRKRFMGKVGKPRMRLKAGDAFFLFRSG